MAADSISGATVISRSGSSDRVSGFHLLKFSPMETIEFPKSSIRYSNVGSPQSLAVSKRSPITR